MNITKGIIPSAQKVVLYGPEGIGKSTLAAAFPDPVFIDTEGSTRRMDVRRMDKPLSWAMLMDQVRYIAKATPCRTLVLDTADWAEQLCTEMLLAKYKKTGIEDFGYGKGYVWLAEEFGRLLNQLEEVISAGVHVVLTAHAAMRRVDLPEELDSYDHWEMKLGKKTVPLVKEWADMVLFATYKTLTVRTSENKVKAQGGQRVLYTTHTPFWDAKNRHGFPDELPMDFASIASAFNLPAEMALADITEKAREQGVPVQFKPAPPSLDPGIAAPLRELMEQNLVSEGDIRFVVSQKGYFPADMPVRDYPMDFIEGVLIAAWDQVYSEILKERPFVED
ncbi:MAG: ATP-binding protein [Oscillospiraceae bacterium]|nr:ATP-binding protein [Oscillospiraceae bacterium]